MISVLDDYDWSEVFGEGSGGNCTPIMPSRLVNGVLTQEPTFSREDVAVINGISEGERDERDWIVWGQLKDGRFFVARGGCRYTGWDCIASNSGDTFPTAEELIRYGMNADERERFGVMLTT